MTNRDPWPRHSTRPARDEVEPGVPATTERPRDIPLGAEDEEEPAPLDVPQGVEDWGTTPREELIGEPFELRVRREQPDRLTSDAARPGVSLYEPGTDDDVEEREGLDVEPDAVADLNLEEDVTMSPEEQAMRIEDEPAGLNYDPSPGYLDDREGTEEA